MEQTAPSPDERKLEWGFQLKRWTDKISPVSLWEIDKNGLAAVISYFLYQWRTNAQDAVGVTGGVTATLRGNRIVDSMVYRYLLNIQFERFRCPYFRESLEACCGEDKAYLENRAGGFIEKLPDYLKQVFGNWVQPHSKELESFRNEFNSYLQRMTSNDMQDAIEEEDLVSLAHTYASYREWLSLRAVNTLYNTEMDDIGLRLKQEMVACGQKRPGMQVSIFNDPLRIREALCALEQTRLMPAGTVPDNGYRRSVMGNAFHTAILFYLSVRLSGDQEDCGHRYDVFYRAFFLELMRGLVQGGGEFGLDARREGNVAKRYLEERLIKPLPDVLRKDMADYVKLCFDENGVIRENIGKNEAVYQKWIQVFIQRQFYTVKSQENAMLDL